jgi:mannose-1-phosphate guanylyltransferase
MRATKYRRKNPDAVTVVTPADHAVFMEDEFVKSCETAIDFVEKDTQLVTIGIKPSRPETGYGYIQFKESENPVKKVKTFTEKPQLELAKTFLESGDFVWNAGIFIWKTSSIIQFIRVALARNRRNLQRDFRIITIPMLKRRKLPGHMQGPKRFL